LNSEGLLTDDGDEGAGNFGLQPVALFAGFEIVSDLMDALDVLPGETTHAVRTVNVRTAVHEYVAH